MQILYFDNVRGFESTYIDLKSVNFFVGENSTGKTSILKLIAILSSVGFWRYGEFGDAETSLGGFEDIVTTPRNNAKDYFEVGIFADNHSDNEWSAFKFRFINKDNFPFLKELCYCNEWVNLQVIVDGKFIRYRYVVKNEILELQQKDFKAWVEKNGLNEFAFSKAPVEYDSILHILDWFFGEMMTKIGKQINGLTSLSRRGLFLSPFVWISPLRNEPQRTYNHQGLIYDPKGSHSPSVLKEILLGPNVKYILNRFGSDSGLYDDITVNDISDSENSNRFELLVSINGNARSIVNVGFGVSQVLPIVIETISRQDKLWFGMQSPEVHLHPRAQAALGDFIFKAYINDKQKFVIETHSDFIIDRFRIRMSRAKREKIQNTDDLAQVIFFSNSEKGNCLDAILINSDGSYPEDQPKEFRNFFVREQLEIISI
jgi:predicted ATPase